jgi:hypothetical protein
LKWKWTSNKLETSIGSSTTRWYLDIGRKDKGHEIGNQQRNARITSSSADATTAIWNYKNGNTYLRCSEKTACWFRSEKHIDGDYVNELNDETSNGYEAEWGCNSDKEPVEPVDADSVSFTGMAGDWELIHSCGACGPFEYSRTIGVYTTDTKEYTSEYSWELSATITAGYSYGSTSGEVSITGSYSETTTSSISSSISTEAITTGTFDCDLDYVFQWKMTGEENWGGVKKGDMSLDGNIFLCTDYGTPLCPAGFCNDIADCQDCAPFTDDMAHAAIAHELSGVSAVSAVSAQVSPDYRYMISLNVIAFVSGFLLTALILACIAACIYACCSYNRAKKTTYTAIGTVADSSNNSSHHIISAQSSADKFEPKH